MNISELVELSSNNKKNLPKILSILFNYIQDIGIELEKSNDITKKMLDHIQTIKRTNVELDQRINELENEIKVLQVWQKGNNIDEQSI